MRITLIGAIVACFSLGRTTEAATCSAITANTDYQGNDLTTVAAASAAACCAPCQATAQCTVFAFANGQCYLKYGSPARITKSGVSTGAVQGSSNTCGAITANTDYQGNDLSTVSASSAAACCAPCQATAQCTVFAFANGQCYLKYGSPARISKAGVSTGAVQGSSTCGTITADTDYQGNDLTNVAGATAADCCAPCQANAQCTVFAFANGQCYLKSGSPARIAKAGVSTGVVKSSPVTSCSAITPDTDFQGNDLDSVAANAAADCCAPCQANALCAGYSFVGGTCFLKFGPLTRVSKAGVSTSVLTAGGITPPALKLVSGTSTPDVRVTPLAFTYAAGYQWYPTTSTVNGVESLTEDFAAFVQAINATLGTHRHGAKPESIVTPTPDGSSVLPLSSAASVAECAALVSAHGQIAFTYAPDTQMCLGHHFEGANSVYLLAANGGSTKVTLSIPDSFILKTAGALSDTACVAACKAAAPCTAVRNANSQCTLYAPAAARSPNVVAGWAPVALNANPLPNLPKFANPSKVHFYTTAHQDDHELFMSNTYLQSIKDASTKVVFVYTTAGDDQGGNGWREARELGTLAATKAYVDHVGRFASTVQSSTVTLLGRQITRVAIGNTVSYFLRVPEYGADQVNGFMALVNNERPVAPMDFPNQPYANRDAFQQVLTQLYYGEASGIGSIQMHAQDPEGPQPDHAMHLATGQLVTDVVASDSDWVNCLAQYYYFDYQKWLDPVNVTPEDQALQRYAWMLLSQAIFNYDNTIVFWSEHSINLGRTYIRRSIHEGAGPCP
ncbi:Aste57867_1151 [Aphanomyces stellatus]|uniref:Aste57867_1151 protein n=1 Tax=Aphanomyces stellatus TaxID=120398 RepID=A0A485K4X6_9STRA|nr:hypothetical protein As57867_001150 [Aphanomyces stellatus]VFT78371.1 Aste57867_1151 [Aphanomyces stellatus]